MKSRGFTLIELLVAISILAIVAVLGWRGLDGIIRARTALTAQLEATRGMQLAFAQMQSDCEHIANTQPLQGRPYLLSAPDRMTMVRNVFNENEPARLQVVAYRITGGQLTRRESNGTRDLIDLDVMWKAAISDIDSNVTGAVTLQTGVTAMQVQTWENNGWRQNTAPIGQSATPPGQIQGKLQDPQNPQTLQPPVLSTQQPTGLQVSLQVTSIQAAMNKSFLLGGL